MSERCAEPCLLTLFPDGTEVHAHAQHDAESEARAMSLGYVGVGAMTLDHDHLHTALAWLLIGRGSPTLRGVAAGIPADPALAQAEECMVLAAQRFMNLARGAGC